MTNTNFREFTYKDDTFSYYVVVRKLAVTEGNFCMNSECKNINPRDFITMLPFEVFNQFFRLPENINEAEFNSIVCDTTKNISNYYLEDIFSYITAIICFMIVLVTL